MQEEGKKVYINTEKVSLLFPFIYKFNATESLEDKLGRQYLAQAKLQAQKQPQPILLLKNEPENKEKVVV